MENLLVVLLVKQLVVLLVKLLVGLCVKMLVELLGWEGESSNVGAPAPLKKI